MAGHDQNYSQWHQDETPSGQGQVPAWSAGQGQASPWNAQGVSGWGPQEGPYPPQSPAAIQDYRTRTIVTLVCSFLFCWLAFATGIPALVYSSRVNESIAQGNYVKAMDASRRARLLSLISVGIIVIFWVIIIIAIAASHSNSSGSS